MKVLLLSAYAARSHEHWRRLLCDMFPDWEWEILELPPRHFSWRIRGNPLYWAHAERVRLEAQYDLVLATSMVDLATLRGLVPELARCRTVLYFHENQFAYPATERQASEVEAQMVSLYSALAADQLLFNSGFNQETFLRGCGQLLGKLPDFVPPGLVDALTEKSHVLPVPIEGPVEAGNEDLWPGKGRGTGSTLRIAWLGRFEYDKGPDGLLHVLRALERIGLPYELAVVGQQFRVLPASFEIVRREFAHRLVFMGFVEGEADFLGLLCGADVALSTALHEFQGLALLQAAACGAIPLVPQRQAYPEVFPGRYCYSSEEGDPAREGQSAAEWIAENAPSILSGSLNAPDVSRFSPARLRSQYRQALVGQ